MKLVYSSEGRQGAPWIVDSLSHEAAFGGQTTCSYIRFGATDVRRLCASGDTLFSWDPRTERLVASRPIGPRMTLRNAGANRSSTLYETGEFQQVERSGVPLVALPTTVTTFDSTGRAVRRLRERYVTTLATALDGVFELPDSAASGGWKPSQRFELVTIEMP